MNPKDRWTRAFQGVIVAILLLLVISEIFLYAPTAKAGITSSLTLTKESAQTFTATLSLKSSFQANLSLAATVSNGVLSDSTLYFYYDSHYPSSWSTPTESYGLSQHVAAVLTGRGLHSNCIILNATQLRGFLTDPANSHSILFMPTGVIPDTVYNKTVNYVAPWVRDGGTLLWFGDTIGFYAGQRNVALSFDSPENPGLTGTAEFVNVSIFGSKNLLYDNQTYTSTAYDYTYYYGFGHDGIDLQVLQSIGGEVLGGTAGGYTNAARIPLGSGTIDYFSVPLTHDVTELSVALSNMLQSGVLSGPFEPVGLLNASVRSGGTAHGTMAISIPFLTWSNSSSTLCVLLYQTNLLAVYGNALCTLLSEGAGVNVSDHTEHCTAPVSQSLQLSKRRDDLG